MVTWNYRVINVPSRNGGEDFIQVCEVYYNEDGRPIGYTYVEQIGGETVQSAKNNWEQIAEAFQHPVLHESQFPAYQLEEV